MQANETDTALVRSARDGDRGAFAVLLARHYPLLLTLCRRMLGDVTLAEDAAQEAALQALLGLDRLRQPARFGPWLAGIGLNVCRRWLQHRPREAWSWEALVGGRLLPEPEDRQPGPEARFEATELRVRLQRAVAALPPGQRGAVLLIYRDGLSQAEAAATLGVGAGAVKTRLFKARRTLRRQLEDIGQEEMAMTTATTTEWIEFRVKDVRRHPGLAGKTAIRHSVVIEEVGGAGRRSVWGIGPFEAEAMAVQLAGVHLPRPLPYTVMARLLEATGGQLREVRLAQIHERVGYGQLLVDGPAGERTIDARLSDVLNLALIAGVPIRVAATLLRHSDAAPTTAEQQQLDAQLYGAGTAGPAEIAAALTQRLAQAAAPPPGQPA